MESTESASTSVDQPKLKRQKKSKKLPPSSPLLSTRKESEQVVEAMEVSGLVETSVSESSCPPVSELPEECASCCAFGNEMRVLNNTVLELRAKLMDKREELKRVKKKLKGRSYLMAAFPDIRIRESIQCLLLKPFEFAPNMIILPRNPVLKNSSPARNAS